MLTKESEDELTGGRTKLMTTFNTVHALPYHIILYRSYYSVLYLLTVITYTLQLMDPIFKKLSELEKLIERARAEYIICYIIRCLC
jgi:hypothetical protein